MKLQIRKNPDPILRVKTVKVKDPLADNVQELVSSMIETMYSANGVGVAATQVGSDLRLCVIETEGTLYVLINPQITAKSKKKIISEEGCLSFPGKFFPIARHEEVQVRYIDENGKPSKLKGRDLLARAIQHELDHLDGILIIDRIKKTRKPKVNEEQTKNIKKQS
jgi:peptide deformylase